ncbi:MAG: DUF1203 domain-containing protein [Parvularculaceae bacterium]|nr:DUF1203 domain-containing protein [Parvularculaceae bacterium]
MTFTVSGLEIEEFRPLFGLSDDALRARGVIRRRADAKPGFPCRVTLEDAEPGETLLLLNHESHKAPTPYRSSYAIFVRERADAPARYVDEIPPVMEKRPIALRIFDRDGMLIGADLGRHGAETKAKIEAIFENPNAAYIHAHNAMHGCFAAAITRS